MKIFKLRPVVQIISFLVLLYGIHVGFCTTNFMPTWLCTNPQTPSSSCYLLPLQRIQKGNDVYPKTDRGLIFPGYRLLWGLNAYVRFLLVLVLFILITNKFWCGWLCPFGTFQDGISVFRKKTGVSKYFFSERARTWIRPIKYIALFALVYTFIPYELGHSMYTPLFCKVCPVKVFLPFLEGNTLNVAVGYPPGVLESIITLIIAAIIFVAIFYKERLFCHLCPVLALMNIFGRFSFLRLKKNGHACIYCGNCWKRCPMDVKQVYKNNKEKSTIHENCIHCLKCIEVCPSTNALHVDYLKTTITRSE